MKTILHAFVVLPLLAACESATMTPSGVSTSDFGAEYLGRPYVADPLGEGAGYDADPLIRTDAFDCQTYVETVLACGDVTRLTKIRYAGGVADFAHRNHFFTADWLANNKGLVENVSGDFGNTAIRTGVIDKRSWAKKVHNMNLDAAPVTAELKYVPYSDIKNFDVSAPMLVAFVVANPVVANRVGSDIFVTHVGFLMPGGVLRHASQIHGQVMDVDFREYIAGRAKSASNLGVAFFEIKGSCK